jgi:aspartate racemase
MGPEATVDLMQRVIQATPAHDDQDHLRMLVDNNPKVPSRIKALLEGSGEDPAPILVQMARDLERWGADFLAMPCNTAHHFYPAIQAAVGVPVLNMIDLTAERIRQDTPDMRKVGLLASTAVIRTDLYGKSFARRGVEVVCPEDKSQDQVLAAIRAIKAQAFNSTSLDFLNRAVDELIAREAGVILIACTELSIVADKLRIGVRAYDSTQVLAEAIVAAALMDKTRVYRGPRACTVNATSRET